jgi:hypothetical protein
MTDFSKVEKALEQAEGIAWDTCHKIYVLMDNYQVELMRKYEYEKIKTYSDGFSPEDMLDLVKEWYADSCQLRFVQSVRTVLTNPNLGYEDLISQFDEIDEDGMY